MFSRVAMITVPIFLCGLFASSAMGQPETHNSNQPTAAEIVKRMKHALEPGVPSVRVMTLRVNGARPSERLQLDTHRHGFAVFLGRGNRAAR